MKKKIMALALCVALAAIAVVGATLAYFTDTAEEKNTFTVGKVGIDLTEPSWKEDADHTMMPGKVYAKDPTITVDENSQDSYIVLDVSINKYSSLFWVMAADASADKGIAFTIFNDDGTLKDDFKNDNGVFSTTNFLKAMNDNKEVFQAIIGKWFTGINHTDWEVIGQYFGDNAVKENYLTLRLAYIGGGNGVVKAEDSIKFMDSFGMPASVTQDMIDSGKTVGRMKNTFNTEKANFNIIFTAYAIQKEGFDSAADAFAKTFGAN